MAPAVAVCALAFSTFSSATGCDRGTVRTVRAMVVDDRSTHDAPSVAPDGCADVSFEVIGGMWPGVQWLTLPRATSSD